MQYYDLENNRRYVSEVHIADLHFGAVDPKTEYDILKEQFLDKISAIEFDILSIDGDLFHKKYMANSDVIYYALKFINDVVQLCTTKNATIIIISGTESHDAGQLQLLYNYVELSKYNDKLDFRIVDNGPRFEYAKGLKILCIPEEYGKGAEYYKKYLDEIYDTVFMHGTIAGSVYGANEEDLDSAKYPVFSLKSFKGCRGPIIAGHVHKAMCLNSYMYYCSNPIRFSFGEEEIKGFCIVLHDLVHSRHYFQLIPIESFRYDTINVKNLEYNDPNDLIRYLDRLLAQGIDYIRVDFSQIDAPTMQQVIEKYYSGYANVFIKKFSKEKNPEINTTDEIKSKYDELSFLMDPSLDEYSKFVHFINHNEGKNFITVERLKAILSGGI